MTRYWEVLLLLVRAAARDSSKQSLCRAALSWIQQAVRCEEKNESTLFAECYMTFSEQNPPKAQSVRTRPEHCTPVPSTTPPQSSGPNETAVASAEQKLEDSAVVGASQPATARSATSAAEQEQQTADVVELTSEQVRTWQMDGSLDHTSTMGAVSQACWVSSLWTLRAQLLQDTQVASAIRSGAPSDSPVTDKPAVDSKHDPVSADAPDSCDNSTTEESTSWAALLSGCSQENGDSVACCR